MVLSFKENQGARDGAQQEKVIATKPESVNSIILRPWQKERTNSQ